MFYGSADIDKTICSHEFSDCLETLLRSFLQFFSPTNGRNVGPGILIS
ncbi:hypothetical protein [Haloferula sp.]